jgi:uncharacterized protein (DUF885 family)
MYWVSGHGEGWALYSERLMGELGYLDDPGAHLGMLDGQLLPASLRSMCPGAHGGHWSIASARTEPSGPLTST